MGKNFRKIGVFVKFKKQKENKFKIDGLTKSEKKDMKFEIRGRYASMYF